ncbi:MAG: AAA family ATPase, partial [Cyanobacteria bacterium]|nr:AAA family ATPase [Cyanobacteriota bacterium]
MHIQQIEIDNFKSFAEKTVIPFRQGFTTISGPNGSGKSNIIDSILFCLGLSSSRTMRAEKLTDLINNSSKKREATVTITFSPFPEDTTTPKEDTGAPVLSDTEELLVSLDQITPEPVEPVEGMIVSDPSVEPSQNKDPLKVARRIKDGPNGYSSTYYLNGRVSTLTEIHEHLSQYNISPGCYNVMMQGDVAGIVNMSPMERRKIVDEIAGVAEFDRKIDQAQQELEATGVNIDRNSILLSEIEGRLEQLSTERDHALKYQKLRDEKTESEKLLLSSKYFGLKQSIASANQNMMQAKKERETTQKTLEGLQAEVVQTRETLMSLSEQVKRKGEDQQIAIKKQIEGLKGHVARKEDSIRFLEQQRTDGYKNIEKMQGEILRQKGNMEVLDSDILQLEHQLKELQGLYQQEAQEYERLNQQFDKMTESTGELSTKRAETREKLGLAEDALGHMNREILNLEAQSSRLQQEILLAQEAKTEGLGKLQQTKEKETQLKEVLAETEVEKKQLEKELKDTQLQYSQVRVSVQAFQSQFNQLNKEYLQLDAQKKAYDDVHFGRAVETILRSDIKGIHGTIAQLGSIDSEYALALEIALGGRLQNIVV